MSVMSNSKDILSDNLNLNKEFPRSPTSLSTLSSSRRDSLRNKTSEPSTPNTPPPSRSTRKRAASLNTDVANHPKIESLALSSAVIPGPRTPAGRDQVCLCQPDPKIPRPRNAFILYRQHYQAQVVAQHPGLANPEISKIIGEQWRDQPIEVKNDWKRLAEEEKQRHQRQYPDYRYQPRRAGKANGARPTSSTGDEPARCPKCGGRFISTPSTPLTPFTPSFGNSRTDRAQPPFTAQTSPPRPVDIDRPHFTNTVMNTPRTIPSYSQMHRHSAFPQQHGVQLGPMRDRDEEMEGISSPNLKRRRFEDAHLNYPPTPSHYGPSTQRLGRPPMPPIGYADDRRGPMAGHSPFPHHPGGMMEPPPRPSPQYSYHAPSPHATAFDESLRLPPLQTQLPPQGTGPPHRDLGHRSDHHQRNDSYARSVEAMVMTIPYINKIKVLSKISPPLVPPGPTSPPQEVRGSVIAVEGSDEELVGEVGRFLEEQLRREPECLVRTWSGDSLKAEQLSDMKTDGTDAANPVSANDAFVKYLDQIHAWHTKSSEITRYITTPIAASPKSTSISTNPGSSPAAISPTTIPATVSNQSHSSSTGANPGGPIHPPSPAASHTSSDKHTTNPRIPIALLPSGFSLTTSDAFASHIPINDAYAPVDHWQWMATLWRGIIGPDLTVYVKSIDSTAPGGNGSDSNNGMSNGSANSGEGMSGREEMARFGSVELRNDCKAVVVRVEKGMSVEEKTLRRLGFEVVEFVRSAGSEGGGGFGRG